MQPHLQPMELTWRSMALIDVDASLLIQLGLFLIFFLVMRSLVFKPVLDTIEKRAEKTEKTRREARTLSARSEELSARYEEEMAAARAKAASAKAALRSEGIAAREQIVGEARAATSKSLDEVRVNVEKQFGTAREQMLAQVDELARMVAARILGRPL